MAKKKFEECDHVNIVTRKNKTFYCKDCGYDSAKEHSSGKLSNLMNQLNKCRNIFSEMQTFFHSTVKDLEEGILNLKKIIREKDKEIEEFKLQVEAMTDG